MIDRNFGHPDWGALCLLAAAAVVVAAATIVGVVAAAHIVVATAAEQDQQDDDPAPVTATKTVVIHKCYLRIFFRGVICRSFQDIPLHKICASILSW